MEASSEERALDVAEADACCHREKQEESSRSGGQR